MPVEVTVHFIFLSRVGLKCSENFSERSVSTRTENMVCAGITALCLATSVKRVPCIRGNCGQADLV